MPLTGLDLRYVAGVSWPRSGHHLLRRLLADYFGDKFGYCEFYTPKDCCKTFPCARGGSVAFSKNHDHDLILPQVADQTYLIQYRDFANSVVSNFDLHVANGNPDTEKSFREFARSQRRLYVRFLDKWVNSDFGRSQLVIHYDELTRDPMGSTARAIGVFAPAHSIDEMRLAQVVNATSRASYNDGIEVTTPKAGVANARVLSDFRFYSRALFEELSNLPVTSPGPRGTSGRMLKRVLSLRGMKK